MTDPDRVASWLWQLLALAWSDTDDLHSIRRVALYLGRHGVLLSWGLDDFANLLLDDSSTARRHRAHDQFLELTVV